MNPSSQDIKDMVDGESSLGLTFGTNLFTGIELSTPDDAVTIFDTPGSPPQLALDDSEYNYPSVQIRVRNNSYLTGWTLINDIKALLHGKSGELFR